MSLIAELEAKKAELEATKQQLISVSKNFEQTNVELELPIKTFKDCFRIDDEDADRGDLVRVEGACNRTIAFISEAIVKVDEEIDAVDSAIEAEKRRIEEEELYGY